MAWVKNANALGNSTCTQFINTAQDQLNPQTLYSTTPFINSNTTQSQTITFSSFKNQTISSVGGTITMDGTASSGLTVTYTSLDTNIATVLNAVVTIHSSGVVYIRANQAGNATYDAATPVLCQLTILFNSQVTGPNTYIQYPPTVTATTTKSYVVTLTSIISDIRYTKYYGISYGYNTGYNKALLVGSVTALDITSTPITDFNSNPITISFSLPHANTSNILHILKTQSGSIVDPQPTGYPVALTYNGGTQLWTGSMTALSEIVIIDQDAPNGNAGGDPYITSIKKIKTLLPNTWKRVSLFKSNNVHIIANCDFIDKSIIDNLHYINKAKNLCFPIDPNSHKWVVDITYIKSLEFVQNGRKLIMDSINGSIISDNSPFLYEKICNNKLGLFSITHGGYYPMVNVIKYIIYFDDGHIILTIDNYWDDINYIELFLHDTTGQSIEQSGQSIEQSIERSGELIEHSESNLITDMNDF